MADIVVAGFRGQLSVLASGVVTSASLLGALLGSVATFLLKDRVGRKTEMFVSASCYGKRLCIPSTWPTPCISIMTAVIAKAFPELKVVVAQKCL